MDDRFESEVQEAMRILKTTVPADNPWPPSQLSHPDPDFEAEVQEAMRILGGVQSQEPEYSYGERAGQVARGAAHIYGVLADIPNSVVESAPFQEFAINPIFEAVSRISKPEDRPQKPERIPAPHLSEALPGYIDKLYGKDLSPKDDLGKFLHGTGEIIAIPVPWGGGYVQAAKTGILPLVKHLGKEALTATGASAGINLTPKLAEEGTILGAIEDIVKGGAGASMAHGLAGAAKTVGSGNLLPKIASKFMTPKSEILGKAAKHDIELPFNVAADSTTLNYIANNYLKSVFTSKNYKDALQKSNDSMINAVKKSIDTLGEANIKPDAGSSLFKESLKEQEKLFKKKSDVMYEKARKLLKNTDKIVPKNTLKALDSEPMMELLSTISPSSSEKSVISRVKEVRDSLAGKGIPKDIQERYKNNPKYLETIEKHLSKRKEVPVTDLINLRKSLLNTLNYETDVRGSEAFLSKLVKTIDSDIKSISNKDALKSYQDANRFFAENIGQRFRRSLGKSILTGEAPVDAYNLMNSAKNVRRLEKIAGSDPKSKAIFDSLKKAKAREILGSAVEGDLVGEGAIRTAPFAKLFQKGEKRQDLLAELVGEQQYKNLSDIAEISNEFSKSGRELLNTSGSAHVLSDISAGKDVAKETMKAMSWLFTGGAVGGTSGLGLAIGVIVAPNVVSRIVSNPKFVTKARAYAIARQQGRERYADTLLKPLVKMVALEISKEQAEGTEKED